MSSFLAPVFSHITLCFLMTQGAFPAILLDYGLMTIIMLFPLNVGILVDVCEGNDLPRNLGKSCFSLVHLV